MHSKKFLDFLRRQKDPDQRKNTVWSGQREIRNPFRMPKGLAEIIKEEANELRNGGYYGN